MNLEKGKPCVTQMKIGDTIYIVESVVSDTAKDTAYDKVKKLIIDNVNVPISSPELAQKSA